MQPGCYIDTSALAKRYIDEPGSEAFDTFCQTAPHDLVITPLVSTEFVGVLQRHVRMGQMSGGYAAQAKRRFHKDVVDGAFRIIDFDPTAFGRAGELMSSLGAPLTTLDALHLACALLHRTQALATADLHLAAAARQAQLDVITFS